MVDETAVWYIGLMFFSVIGYGLAEYNYVEFAGAFLVGAIICLYKQITSSIKQTRKFEKRMQKYNKSFN